MRIQSTYITPYRAAAVIIVDMAMVMIVRAITRCIVGGSVGVTTIISRAREYWLVVFVHRWRVVLVLETTGGGRDDQENMFLTVDYDSVLEYVYVIKRGGDDKVETCS